ncbi:MAG: dolichyl-phosphate beta-glucosyltransferase [Nanoarchaeota archaeon]
MNLSIIIPAYNEEQRIKKTLEAYSNFYSKKLKTGFEIIVVLNGCIDNTLSIVSEYSKKHKFINHYDFKEKIGKGGAIIEGFKAAKGSLIGYVDADLATSPEAFYDLIEKIKGCDGIIASRYLKNSIVNKKQPIQRVIASRIFNVLVRLLFDMKFHDTQCGAKLFKKNAVDSIKNDLGITQFSFDVDLLYRLKLNGFKIIETPTVWNDQKDSKLVLKKTAPNMFFSIMRLRLRYSRLKFIVTAYDKIHDVYLKK